MKISYSYRGKKIELEDDFDRPKIGIKGQVSFQSGHWTDGNRKIFNVTLEPHELLKTVHTCLNQLNQIAGTNYKVYNNV